MGVPTASVPRPGAAPCPLARARSPAPRLRWRYTLAGINVYAHHPHYPGGSYTYFPLFLYLELPFQWLALHTGVSFTVLGKLPIMAGDVLAAALIAAHLGQRGHGDGVRALGTGLYFLNPLVLY